MKHYWHREEHTGTQVSESDTIELEKTYVWLPNENEEASVDRGWIAESITPASMLDNQYPLHERNASLSRRDFAGRRDYDVNHYTHVLINSYAARLRKAFSPEDFAQLFRLESQPGLFD